MEKNKKPTSKKIKKNNLELKKPSELCQVLFFSDFNKKNMLIFLHYKLIWLVHYFI